MNNSRWVVVLAVLSCAALACAGLAPGGAAPTPAESITAPPPTAGPVSQSTPAPTAAPATVTPAPTTAPAASPAPTAAPLALEVVQSQTWDDRFGDTRTNVLVRNPYEFPVAPRSAAQANLLNSAGESVRAARLYFLDGISGGGGFILPGETAAATVCYTCETTPLSGPWASVAFMLLVEDASTGFEYATDVEALPGQVTFEGDGPLFYFTGSVKNNSEAKLSRIAYRVQVFDQTGTLVGAGEASAWEVGAGATASISGVGTGQPPEGPFEVVVSALGVNY